MLTRRHLLAGSAAALAAGSPAWADTDWPTKPVKVIIPYPPAGGADTTGRIFFQNIHKFIAKQNLIPNK